MAIAVDNAGQTVTGGAVSSITLASFVVGAGPNRLLVVCPAWRAGGGVTSVTGITFIGTALTRLGGITEGANNTAVDFWYLIAPANSTGDIVVTFSDAATSGVVVGATSWTGVHQTTPLGVIATANGNSTAPSVNVTSAADDVVHDGMSWENGTSSVATVNASQTQRWNAQSTTVRGGAGSSKVATGTPTTMSWTLSVVEIWATCGAAIKPAAAGAGTFEDDSFGVLRVPPMEPNVSIWG